MISIVESNGDSIVNDFKIILNDNGEYAYSMTSEVQRLRFLADVFGKATIDKLSNKQKAYSAADLMHYLCTDDTYGYGLDEQKLSKEEILKLVTIRYSMGLNRYQKYVATTIASDVSESTTAAIMENLDTLQGVNIEEDSIRYYPDSKYFASILGYTGVISQDEYDALDEKESDSYSLTDVVGKAGLEQTLDKTLQGEKGEIKLCDDGKIKGEDDLISGLKTQHPTMFEASNSDQQKNGDRRVLENKLPSGDKDKTVTKEQFLKMGYNERMKLKEENPELFKQLNVH